MTDDDEVREALRGALATAAPPPPMSPAAALRAGRRARRNRSVIAAGSGSVATVAAVAAAVALSGGNGGSPGLAPGGPARTPEPTSTAQAGSTPVPTAPATLTPGPTVPANATPGPSDEHSGAPWPTGPDGLPQSDRTAKAGPRYDQGVALLDAVLKSVPNGFSVPNSAGQGEVPLRYQQAQFEDRVNGTDVWSYMATTAMTKDGRTGNLMAEVHTVGNTLPTEPCAQTTRLWGMTGTCEVVTVGTAKVGVVVSPTGSDRRWDRWASYRHPDGVVVYVAVAKSFDTSKPALTQVPYTTVQLAALAVDTRFDLK